MSDGEAILRAILDEPSDDFHRLAYADWLEESGEEKYAEFIRAQLALVGIESTCGSESGDYRCRSLSCELCPLLRRQDTAWLEVPRIAQKFPREFKWTIHAGPDISPPVAHIRRGFVESVQCRLADWLEHGPAIVRRHPVERVTVTDREPNRDPRLDGLDYCWFLSKHPAGDPLLSARPYWLPCEVHPGGDVLSLHAKYSHALFTTPEAANAALSAALVAWAKAEARKAEELPA